MRPKSIVQFEQVFLAIIVLGLITTALSWETMTASVQVQRMMAQLGPISVYATLVFGLLIQGLLWYFIARRGSVVAKWIFVVLTALGMVSSIWSIAMHGAPSSVIGIIGVVTLVLDAVAIMLLFRPDTPQWFGEDTAAV